MIGWLVRILMLGAGIVAGWFVPRDQLGYRDRSVRRSAVAGSGDIGCGAVFSNSPWTHQASSAQEPE